MRHVHRKTLQPLLGGSDTGLSASGLEDASGRELVEELESLPLEERPTDFVASVETEEVVMIEEDGNESSVPLPEDEFYLSVAPYVDQTHDCFFHSLTTCVGEMGNEELEVTVVDEDTGEALFDETVQTHDNGFFGLWLPRDLDAELTIEHDGLTSTAPISTGEGDPTCLTTSQLM
ncbi:CueP family metal-binding protein [Nesterenkonia sphaerica]|uniref:Uncharacterized protein n=1 Tax=Nesterenkonia sphaerica TaxID=1804988 RepID=A0A5R8ZZ51_9MICC|nr:CueP family metal-binding protein [Nesterenkonia sphaerica]TLP71722.1 hypothetical protein FEF27_12460 [Nesterenkonia sphaerica]